MTEQEYIHATVIARYKDRTTTTKEISMNLTRIREGQEFLVGTRIYTVSQKGDKILFHCKGEVPCNGTSFKGVTKDTLVKDLCLSERLRFALKRYLDIKWPANIPPDMKVEALGQISVYAFRRVKNVGDKTLNELIELCKAANVTLKP